MNTEHSNDWKSLVEKTKRKNLFITLAVLGGVSLVCVSGFLLLLQPQSELLPPPNAEKETAKTNAYEHVLLSAKSAIVYDLVTGETLYEKNAEAQLPLASLTKLLTLYAASNALSRETEIVLSSEALSAEGDNGFTVGETFTFADLARFALVASSNDAAEAIAQTVAERRKESRESMLASAASALGLSQTYATNGTGLDENGTISGGYGSARDIAILAGELLNRIPEIARATLNPTVQGSSSTGKSYTLKNTNPDAGHISGLLLSKTGYTDLAGGNLAIVYDAALGHPIAIVVLGSTRDERFVDVENLVRATSAQFSGFSL